MQTRIFAVVLATVLIAAACGGSTVAETSADTVPADSTVDTTATEPGDASGSTTASDAPAPPAAEIDSDSINGGKPEVEVPAGDPPLALETVDLVDGTGTVAESGDFLSMHYVGVFHADGEQFDASWDRGATFDFRLGQGQVIQGWDDGIAGMAVGGRRLLSIPAEQAYGSDERPGIPADSALVFVVDLVSVLSPPTVVNAPAPVTELEVSVVDEGNGEEIKFESVVDMHFVAMAQTTGEVFDSSWERGQSIQFQVGVGQGLAAWDEGLIGKRVGDTVRFVIPSLEGLDPSIEGSTVITEVTILDIIE